ncbi:hypothetical protein [Candidatus Palauibacter sp.]|uniref:hypothetical protein n=1 Tax=Candidatus Palauibacter sp. TaxID=3101350 RepID=UPI003AF2ECF8
MTAGDIDPGVIIRALRFKAEMAGYRLERGHYMDRPDDRADRWYVVPLASTDAPRAGSGFKTMAEAAKEAENLGSGGEASMSGTTPADPASR